MTVKGQSTGLPAGLSRELIRGPMRQEVPGLQRYTREPDSEAILCLCRCTRKHPLTVSVIQVIVKSSTRNNHLSDDVSNLSQTTPLRKYSKGCHLTPISQPGWPRAFDYCHHCNLHR